MGEPSREARWAQRRLSWSVCQLELLSLQCLCLRAGPVCSASLGAGGAELKQDMMLRQHVNWTIGLPSNGVVSFLLWRAVLGFPGGWFPLGHLVWDPWTGEVGLVWRERRGGAGARRWRCAVCCVLSASGRSSGWVWCPRVEVCQRLL